MGWCIRYWCKRAFWGHITWGGIDKMRWSYTLKRLALTLSVFFLLLAASATVAEAASFSRKLAEQVNEIAGNQIESKDTAKEKLQKIFSYVEQTYVTYDMQEFIMYTDWEQEYAGGLYTAKEGSSFHFAAGYALLAKKVTNYEVRIGVGRTSGFMTELPLNHAWVEIKIDGTWYICDPYMDKLAEECSGKYFLLEREEAGTIYDGFNSTDYTKVVLKKQWITEKGKKYYLKSNWDFPAGSYKIDGIYYIFNAKGMLLQPEKDSLSTVGKTKYFVSPKGKPVPGWHIVSGKLYNAKKTGEVRKNTKYEGVTFGSTGAAKNDDACKLKKKVMTVVASITKSNMTKEQKLRACWNYMVSKKRFRYVSKYPNLNEKDWITKTACNMLSTKTGNCYSFACAFAALTKEIGYKPYVVCARISGRRDRARDGLTRHAWVRINGKYYDPEAQFAGWRGGIYGIKGYPIRHKIQKIVRY